ncbi:hypothetical protein [Arenimonas composti]|uniref:Uncharacterized protein n=1 Tax=Arenimonas composti TR7-09 = DSM 18010 TaxID=1121013 RepID=A0A091BBH9_9GAMM|nr:hypothetical protein [Arenimonas composti]KFN49096.1 hypothetical protein P873_12445 [Arenimonas composti TR7-09 = DSM 18010]
MSTMNGEREGRSLRNLMWLGAAALLALPGIAMWRGVEGVHWTGADFAVMGVMLATLCGLVELGARLSRSLAYRAAFAIAAGTGFLTVWVNLAVGMIGNENDAANLVFAGVLGIAAVGTAAAGFRARGMAWAMAAAGVAQLGCAGFALFAGTAYEAALIALFALPWLLAAALFRAAQA